MNEREKAIADRIGIDGVRVIIHEDQGMGFRDAVGVEYFLLLRHAVKLPVGESVDQNTEDLASQFRIWFAERLQYQADSVKDKAYGA